jgi:hypothetical protein
MIIFYQKSTGNIIGTIEGRIHDKNTLEKSWIQPDNIPKNDIGKYIVLFEPNLIRGKIQGLKPVGSFANLILEFEDGKKRVYDYKVNLNQKGQVEGFEKT